MPDAIDTWLNTAATPLPLDAPDALAGLDLNGADVVFLGELNHFVHEKSDFRTLFARPLIARGYDAFAEELGWSDGLRLDRYFRTRDEAVFDRISLFGWRGDLRTDRDDGPPPVFRASADAYPTALMRAEQTRFYRSIAPRAFFGIDIAADVGGAYADLIQLAAGEPGFRAALARRGGETIAEEIARLESLRAPDDAQTRETLAAQIDYLRYVSLLAGARTYEQTAPAMAFREDAMKRRFATARDLTGGKMVLMAHGLHLARNDALISAAPGVSPGGGQASSLGHHITQELRLKTFSIWMIYGAGEDSQPLPDLPRVATYPRDTLNARLAQRFDRPTLISVDGAPDAPIGIGHLYNGVFRTRLRGQTDALYFLPRVTPMRAG